MRIGKKVFVIFASLVLGWYGNLPSATKAISKPKGKHLIPNECGQNAVDPQCQIDWEKYCIVTTTEMSPLLGIEYRLSSGIRGFEPAYILPGERIAVDPNTGIAMMRICCCNRIRDIENPRKIVAWTPTGTKECSPPETIVIPTQKVERATPSPQPIPVKEPLPIPKINVENPPIKPPEKMEPEPTKKSWYSTGWGKTLLITGGAIATACLTFDIGPCGNDDDRDNHNGCKFGKGVDGRCLHPCNPADPNCISPPPCIPGSGPDCPCPPEHPDCDADMTRNQTFGNFMEHTSIRFRNHGFDFLIAIPIGKKPNPAP
ncbi:MAG: hypothetical protein AAB652_01580 [Patescibacteria group bacterium]